MHTTRHINPDRNGNRNAAKRPTQWKLYRATVDLYLLLHRGALPRRDALEQMYGKGYGHNCIHGAAALIGVPPAAPGYVAFWQLPDPAPDLLDLLQHIEQQGRMVGKHARTAKHERYGPEAMRRWRAGLQTGGG
ncbi:hypothetical protein F3K02_16960 [Hydrogenophaga sp. D2P1]|uniref:Uncharacterized protein n=1 Tax=Hydrogenophaga aromaticivorans TaxID=2610898 RepID=A0A7Y8GZ92_9BURK|nr:hypothetical protein [Hydrogenophaga aromaticivorans]NWF46929.1 hypothetical protein [Hydrogenophaga aromaticivorans]